MTHDELCERAARWLRNTKKCAFVLREAVSQVSETPDAIGWRYGRSVLVECKTSLSDFMADRKKPFRHANAGMGEERFYMTSPKLLTAVMMPDGWGLLEVLGRSVMVLKSSTPRTLEPTYYRNELMLMVRGIRLANGEDERPTKRSAALVRPDTKRKAP